MQSPLGVYTSNRSAQPPLLPCILPRFSVVRNQPMTSRWAPPVPVQLSLPSAQHLSHSSSFISSFQILYLMLDLPSENALLYFTRIKQLISRTSRKLQHSPRLTFARLSKAQRPDPLCEGQHQLTISPQIWSLQLSMSALLWRLIEII